MKVYLYRTTYRNGVVYQEGVLDRAEDIFIEEIAPVDTTSDKCLWDIQKFLDDNYPEAGLTFEYQEQEVEWKS